MAGRIVLFGATGYTGELTGQALVERGARPLLAARNATKLDDLTAGLGGGLETATADVAHPPSIAALVSEGDVLVTTVGPFAKWGNAAAGAAVETGAHYLDSTGEPSFVREVFERFGVVAKRRGCGMVTAFGYDWVPGNLAGALALREAGEQAVRVDTGYFNLGGGRPSGGTAASLAGAAVAPSFAFRDGGIVTERGAKRVRKFKVHGKERAAVSAGASENFALPSSFPSLREVNSYLGWFGPASRAMQALSTGGAGLMRLPVVERAYGAATERFVKGSTGGPSAEERAKARSHIVGIAYDAGGRQLAEVHLEGVDGYTFTARILAWGAERAAREGMRGSGALGPVEAFGLDELEAGCAEAGLSVV